MSKSACLATLAWKMEDATCDLPKEDETTKGIDVLPHYFPVRYKDVKAKKRACRS